MTRMWWLGCVGLAMGCSAGEGPLGVHEVSPGPSGGEAVGWLELTNRGSESGSMDGWSLSLDEGAFSFRDDLVLEPGSFALLRAGDGAMPATFPTDGFELLVSDADGREVQRIEVPAMEMGVTYGRVPDGPDNWQLMDPTPGRENR